MQKEMFEWCTKCALHCDCYDGSGIPHFIEPSCDSGPYNPQKEGRLEEEDDQ